MVATPFLKLSRISGLSQNPDFPGWIPITKYWFGDEEFVADVIAIKIGELFSSYEEWRVGSIGTKTTLPDSLVTRRKETAPSRYFIVPRAIVTFVFMADQQVVFTTRHYEPLS